MKNIKITQEAWDQFWLNDFPHVLWLTFISLFWGAIFLMFYLVIANLLIDTFIYDTGFMREPGGLDIKMWWDLKFLLIAFSPFILWGSYMAFWKFLRPTK